MKSILRNNLWSIFFLIIFPLFTYSQDFNQYRIGEKLEGKDMINTSIGGLEGTLFIYTNKKGIIRSMGFVPSKDGGRNPAKIYKGEFINFKSYIEQFYQIGFERTLEVGREKQHYSATYNGCKVVISIDEFGDDKFDTANMVFMINKL